MKVLMITHELHSDRNPNTIPQVSLQIKSLENAGIRTEILELTGRPKIKYIQAIPKLLKKVEQFDLVHAHYGYCGMLARIQLQKPLIVSFMGSDLLGTPDHDGRLEWGSRLEIAANCLLARCVDGVIVKSDEMARVLPSVKTRVIPNGVDMVMFSPQDKRSARKALGWPEQGKVILFPGNPDVPRKGYPFARDAVLLAEKKIGEPIQIRTLKQVHHTRVPMYMNAADLIIMTSYIEGSPNVVKEAMSCNRPVLGVPVGDVAELLYNVQGCRVVERDVEVFSKTIVDMITQDYPVASRVALRQKGLSIESVTTKIIELYQSVLG